MANPSEKKEEDAKMNPSCLLLDDLGPGILESSYLIRGCVLQRAGELTALKEKGEQMPFEKICPLHYGNPQLLGQPPISFIRQVIAACFYPPLLDAKVFPEDVVKRTKEYLKAIPNEAVGAYADAPGFDVFRQCVSRYISKRDGFECDYNSIYLTDGTLDGMIFLVNLFFSKKGTGLMLPVPGFPGYSFLSTQAQGKVINYPLNEEDNWAIEVSISHTA